MADNLRQIKTALISVFHKDGLDEILALLHFHCFDLFYGCGGFEHIFSYGFHTDHAKVFFERTEQTHFLAEDVFIGLKAECGAHDPTPATTAWVKGYIVGSAPGKSADSFTTETGANAANTNIFIAASASETDYAKCVAVQCEGLGAYFGHVDGWSDDPGLVAFGGCTFIACAGWTAHRPTPTPWPTCML